MKEDYNQNPQRMIMPFGKYKGEYLGDIPKKYLEWLLDNTDINLKLKECIKRTVAML